MTGSDPFRAVCPAAPGPALGRRRFVALAGGLLAAPAIVRPARAATTAVKFGQIEPLTGPSAAYGLRSRDGARVAVDTINAAGGFHDSKGNVYTIDMQPDDMANDPRQAITLYRQQALDPAVRATIGPTNSVGYVPLVPIAGQLRLVFVGEAGAPVKRWTPWAYRVDPVGGTAVPVVLTAVANKEHFKRLGIIYDQTQDAQAGDAEVCRQMKGKLGYDIVADEAFSSGGQDFSPQIATIKNARPDAIYVASTTGDGVKVVPQLRAAGIDVPLMTGYGAFEDPLYWNGTNGLIKGNYTWLAQDLSAAKGDLRNWLDEYNKKFENKATSYSTYGFDAVMSVVECIKRAASIERDKIQEVMASLDYQSPLGTHVTFKNPPNGENLTPTVTVVQVTGPGTYTAVS
ncbi:MAG: ABC transporter substrate-binding protein [Acidisphaera sp.]|nr:ABC transporter substrate-binding protein [Acidisphaera sp.]